MAFTKGYQTLSPELRQAAMLAECANMRDIGATPERKEGRNNFFITVTMKLDKSTGVSQLKMKTRSLAQLPVPSFS